MTIFYQFKGRLSFKSKAESKKHCAELLKNVFTVFWKANPNCGLRQIYTEDKKLIFDARGYVDWHQTFYETVTVIKQLAMVAKSGRVRVYEDKAREDVIPLKLRQKKKELDDYNAYLKSLGKDILDSRKINYIAPISDEYET
jgi:hypothetical protein